MVEFGGHAEGIANFHSGHEAGAHAAAEFGVFAEVSKRAIVGEGDEGGTKNQILLFGFTDNAGASGENEAVSLNRAKVVEKEFIQRGIRPTIVKGFGSELPVASNDTAEGRAMNRRVEIWMRK